MRNYVVPEEMHIELKLIHWRELFKIAEIKMKLLLILPLSLCFLFSTKTKASRTFEVSSVCESFASGKIDAYNTLEALDINIDDYSIGVNNTAKIFCS
tara:strand:- start:663 stop:956 length:294 start_codon:yes stop_codon:yes gene_type:complete